MGCCSNRAQRRSDKMDEPLEIDMEALGKVLDDVILRSPLGPKKTWDYYQLTFADDSPRGKSSTDVVSGGYREPRTTADSVNDTMSQLQRCDCNTISSKGKPVEVPDRTFRNLTKTGEHLKLANTSSGIIDASPIKNSGSAKAEKTVLNKNLAEKQSGLAKHYQELSGNSRHNIDPPRDNGITDLKQSTLLFTREHIGVGCVDSAVQNSQCLPLNSEKVKLVTAVEGSCPIDIQTLTCPYVDEDSLNESRYQTCNSQPAQHTHSSPGSFYLQNKVENNQADMYGYGYGRSSGDSTYRRYSGGTSSSALGYRSPSYTQRSTSYSRPTMISSISYGSRPRDTSYSSSSLRRTSSLGSDKSYYSTDYAPRDHYSNTGSSSYRTTLPYTRSNTAENVPSSDNNRSGVTEDNTLSQSAKNSDTEFTDSHTMDYSSENTTSKFDSNSKYPVDNAPFSRNSRKYSSTNSTRSDSGVNMDGQDNKVTSCLYLDMNYDKTDPEKKTSRSNEVMGQDKNNDKSSTSMRSANKIQDGPHDSKKVVSQLQLNTQPEKQNRQIHNRQIWSRTDESTNLSSENYISRETTADKKISKHQYTEQPSARQISHNIDSSQNLSQTTTGKQTRETSKHFTDSNNYCTPLLSVTTKAWPQSMGANVQSTQSSASADEDTQTNMDRQDRRRDSFRNRHRSEEEDYVLTESTASFVFKDGQWVKEESPGDQFVSTTTTTVPKSDIASATSATTTPYKTSAPDKSNTASGLSTQSRSYSRDIPNRSTSLSSAGSVSPSKYESANSGPDSPGPSTSSYVSKGHNSGRTTGDKHSSDNTHTAMNLYTERMNLISGFDRDKSKSQRDKQTVVTETLQIPFSPPTFKVDNSDKTEAANSKYSSPSDNKGAFTSSYQRNRPEFSSRSDSSKFQNTDRKYDRSSHVSNRESTKETHKVDKILSTAGTNSSKYNTPYYVTEPPDDGIKREESASSESVQSTTKFIDNQDKKHGDTGTGSQISTHKVTLDGRQNSREERLYHSDQLTQEAKPGTSKRPYQLYSTSSSPKPLARDSSDSYSSGNSNRENDTTSPELSPLSKTGSDLTSNTSNKEKRKEVTRDGSDVQTSDRDVYSVGEKTQLGANERLDTVSTTSRAAPATQLLGNSSTSESLDQDDGLLNSNTDTKGFSEIESMSNNQISERRGGIYYSGNVSRRNVTGLLASEQEDLRRALALSQTETQRTGEMVQTNDTPGNRSELRQIHAGQTSTRKAAGIEVSKDGDLSRSRDVTDTVDRSRTDTEHKTENSSGGVDVSKVREDRQVHKHEDRQLQSEIKKDGREVRQSSTSQSESAQVSRVEESGDSRVSKRQERHFKSSKVTRSSRTSGGSFSGDDSLRNAVRFDSDDSDDDWPSNKREIEGGPSNSTVDRFTKQDSDDDNNDNDDHYHETIVHENKAAELLKSSVTRTDREGTINLSEERQRGVLDRGVTRNISDEGGLRTQRVQQRSQAQSARRTASSSSSFTSESFKRNSGTVSAEDQAVILAAIQGRLGEKEVEPFAIENHPSAMNIDANSGFHATLPMVRNTEDVEGDENGLTPEQQSQAIAKARQQLQARNANVRRPVARKRTIIVDEEMMEEMFLRCIICRDRYDTEERTPKLLPCHHTFCLDCLKEMFRVESESRQALVTVYRDNAPSFVTIHCPTCRASHMITDKDFKSYKSDHKLLELLEISASPNKGSLGYCRTHRTQITDHFCETCLQAVCTDCKVLDHREQDGHTVYSREEALRLYANKAMITVRDVDAEDRQLANMESKLKNAIEVIDGKLESSDKLIRQTFDKFKVAINNRQDQLLDKIENEMGKRREEFSGELEEVNKRMETIEKTQTTTKQAQEDEDVEKMFTAHQNAREMFKNNFEVTKDPKQNIKAAFFYEKRDRANIMNTVSDHGMMTFQS